MIGLSELFGCYAFTFLGILDKVVDGFPPGLFVTGAKEVMVVTV